MKLTAKTVLLHLTTSTLILVLVSVVLSSWLTASLKQSIRQDISSQLAHLDFYLSDFFGGLEADLENLLAQPVVRTRDDAGFTSFLTADPKTFRYHYGPTETEIIRLFNTYRLSHSIVSSVYMGRENGSFVRSHPRGQPTTYDPRTRPWYQLAKNTVGRIGHTAPYPSVTNSDINLGIVKALLDDQGNFFGVVGMDVTLNRLTDYLSAIKFNPTGSMLVVDKDGVIISAEDRRLLFTRLADSLPDLNALWNRPTETEGQLRVGGVEQQVISRLLGDQGWKAFVLIPEAAIQQATQGPVMQVMLGLALGLFLLSGLAILGLNIFVLRPIRQFSAAAVHIGATGDLALTIELSRRDELGELARSWTAMLASLRQARDNLQTTEQELRRHRDHLEILVEDRTQSLVLAKEKAEAADRLKSAFLATMSHELRTPLNSIIGFTGIILKGLVGPLNPEQAKQLSMVKNSANHLLALINDVLDISKIEAGQFTVAHEAYDLKLVLDKALQAAQPLADKKGLTLGLDLQGSLPELVGDARRVEQILLNLLSNAIKFTDKGSVTVVVRTQAAAVEIEVHDTGIGIKAEHLGSLFQAFRQIDSGLTRQYEGTGLGLSISQRLVRLMGGELTVESHWGQGSSFRFTLPVGSST